MNLIKKLFFSGVISVFLCCLFVFICNKWIVKKSAAKAFDNVMEIPFNEVALLLGTNPKLYNGYKNPYFENRINAVADLYRAGKIKHIIASGDNSRKTYNEPEEMKKALIEKGIPESAITFDFAGFRTLDSVVRSEKVFQQKSITIVSQAFHNYRALFIADYYGLNAVAYNAKDAWSGVRTKTSIREIGARCKAVLDLYILKKQPKYLGQKIEIKISK